MLARGENSDLSVLDWIKLVSEAFDKCLVEGEQIRVFALKESLLFKICNELVTNLMPKSINNNKERLLNTCIVRLISGKITYFSLNCNEMVVIRSFSAGYCTA